jgi:integral membrane protein
MSGSFSRYRVMAYVTGTMLLVLVFIAMPIKYLGHNESVITVVGPLHGVLYMVYVVFAFDLAVRAKWSLLRTVLMLAAGAVPFLSFYVERKASGWLADRAVPAKVSA